MIGVITADIISSRKLEQRGLWLKKLRDLLDKKIVALGISRWEIFRGDSFQIELKDPTVALRVALIIRSSLKAIPEFSANNLDVRLAIGVGKKGFKGKSVSEADGEAYQLSGLLLNDIEKSEDRMAVNTPWTEFNEEMSVSFKLANAIMESWTSAAAEAVQLLLLEDYTQEKLARKLKVSQPAVHKRLKQAHFQELALWEKRFQLLVKKLAKS